jgi:hypothetical protein
MWSADPARRRPGGAQPTDRLRGQAGRCPNRAAADDAAPGLHPGPRGAASLWACPQQAIIPGPARSRWKGQSMARAQDLERANAAPGRYVEVPTVAGGSCGHNGWGTRAEQPICKGERRPRNGQVAGHHSQWSRVGRRFGAERMICAMARVGFEQRRRGPQVLGGPLRPLRHPYRRHPPRRPPMAHPAGRSLGWAPVPDLGWGRSPNLHGMQVLMSDRVGYAARSSCRLSQGHGGSCRSALVTR